MLRADLKTLTPYGGASKQRGNFKKWPEWRYVWLHLTNSHVIENNVIKTMFRLQPSFQRCNYKEWIVVDFIDV